MIVGSFRTVQCVVVCGARPPKTVTDLELGDCLYIIMGYMRSSAQYACKYGTRNPKRSLHGDLGCITFRGRSLDIGRAHNQPLPMETSGPSHKMGSPERGQED